MRPLPTTVTARLALAIESSSKSLRDTLVGIESWTKRNFKYYLFNNFNFYASSFDIDCLTKIYDPESAGIIYPAEFFNDFNSPKILAVARKIRVHGSEILWNVAQIWMDLLAA